MLNVPLSAGHLSKIYYGAQPLPYFPNNSFNFALVVLPTTPVPFSNPQGAKISEAYFSWKRMTAALVKNRGFPHPPLS
jgi:hypothetical protein